MNKKQIGRNIQRIRQVQNITQEDKLLMQNIYNYLKTRNKKKK